MIAALFVPPGVVDSEAPRFRGRALDFWIPFNFPGIPFVSPETLPEEAEFLLLCNPAFLPVFHGQAEALDTWIRRTVNGKHVISLGDGALQVMTRDAWPDATMTPAEEVDSPDGLVFMDSRSCPQEIEALVAGIQLEWLGKRNVQVEDRGNFYMEGLIPVGEGSVIGPGTNLRGKTRVGKNVRLAANCWIENSEIGDDCLLLPGCVIRDSRVEEGAQIGPYAHLRMQAMVGPRTRVGNFVEIKKSLLGEGSKASHLTYLGDARIGRNVNVGAGTITCNYDGVRKNITEIGDDVFIGSGTELVAPVKLGRNSYVGAGSTITQDVPEDSLGVARQRQRNVLGWRLRKSRKSRK